MEQPYTALPCYPLPSLPELAHTTQPPTHSHTHAHRHKITSPACRAAAVNAHTQVRMPYLQPAVRLLLRLAPPTGHWAAQGRAGSCAEEAGLEGGRRPCVGGSCAVWWALLLSAERRLHMAG